MAKDLSEKVLRKNAKEFEFLYLLPKESNNKKLDIRMEINSQWNGWTLRAEVIESVGLNVGDTILAKAKPFFSNGLIDDDDEIPLFAGGDVARWIIENNVTKGTIIDCRVKFSYTKARLNKEGDEFYKLSLILEEGYKVVSTPSEDYANDHASTSRINIEDLKQFLSEG